MVNGYCNQPLRATVDTETLFGPGDMRFMMRGPVARLLLSRSPIMQVLGGTAASAYTRPPQWATIPAEAFFIEKPVIGVYGTTSPGSSGDGGQAVLLGPGYVTPGRYNWMVQVQTVNGWPHAGITVDALAGATTLQVDDCTGWGPPAGTTTGAVGTIHDPGEQEDITATAATAAAGPGTLTLASPLAYNHTADTLVTTFPGTVVQASILFACSQALVRGATSTTVQAIPGSAGGGGKSPEDMAGEAELLCHPFKRTI